MKTVFHIFLALVWLCSSGCTSQLWEDTNPNGFIWMGADEITEEELKDRGVKYQVYTSDVCNGFLLEKTTKNKFKDYNLRLLGAPITLTVDAASAVVVVAAYVLYANPDATCSLLNEICN